MLTVQWYDVLSLVLATGGALLVLLSSVPCSVPGTDCR